MTNNVYIEEALKRRLPWRQRFALAAAAAALLVTVYVGAEYYRFRNSDDDHRQVFLPTWFHYNKTKWRYPQGISYFDGDAPPPLDADFPDHVRYLALAEMGHSQPLRTQLRALGHRPPWALTPQTHQVWVELKGPTVCGPSITFSKQAPRVQWRWRVKPVNGYDIELGELVMETTAAALAPTLARWGYCGASAVPYNVKFALSYLVDDDARCGVRCHGRVDFDHFALSGGAKVTSLIVNLPLAEYTVVP